MTSSRSTSRFALLVGFSLMALALVAQPLRAQEEYLGYVWDLQGTWLSGPDTLYAGKRIAEQDSVRPTDIDDELHVLVVVTEGGDRLRFVCDQPAACAEPIAPVDSLGENTIGDARDRVARIVRAVGGLLHRSGQKSDFEPGYVRGENFREAVVLRGSSSLDLTPLFRGHEAGRFRVEIAPVRDGGGDVQPIRTTVSWTPGEQVLVESPTAENGLHRIEVARASGLFSPEMEVLVLVTDEGDYAQTTREFEDAVAVTRGWDDAPAEEIRHFLRLYLQHLADTLSR